MELPFAESWKIKMVEPIRKSTLVLFFCGQFIFLEDGNENIPIVSWREIIKTILDFRCITILDVNLHVFINIDTVVLRTAGNIYKQSIVRLV